MILTNGIVLEDLMGKQLSEMTLEEQWELFPVVLKEHNSEYSEWFRKEKQNLSKHISTPDIKRISHIGSSAVKGLISKPTVDILLEVDIKRDMETLKAILEDSGWVHMSSLEKPYLNMSFNKGYTPAGLADKVFHLHVRYFGDWDELYFRDYLIKHDEVAQEYAKLKLSLLKEYKNDRDGYTDAKSSFIKEYTKKARKEFVNKYKPEIRAVE